VIKYLIFLCRLAQQWGRDRNKIWRKGSLGDEDDAQTSSMRIACTCPEKARDTTLDDEK